MKTAEGKEAAVMANQIARARHALNVQEQRFVLWIVGKIDPFAKNDSESPFAVTRTERISQGKNRIPL
jgi:hypothetical protein